MSKAPRLEICCKKNAGRAKSLRGEPREKCVLEWDNLRGFGSKIPTPELRFFQEDLVLCMTAAIVIFPLYLDQGEKG